MKKLKLNKETISELNKEQMERVEGGLSLASCTRGSALHKKCCGWGTGVYITFGTGSDNCY